MIVNVSCENNLHHKSRILAAVAIGDNMTFMPYNLISKLFQLSFNFYVRISLPVKQNVFNYILTC